MIYLLEWKKRGKGVLAWLLGIVLLSAAGFGLYRLVPELYGRLPALGSGSDPQAIETFYYGFQGSLLTLLGMFFLTISAGEICLEEEQDHSAEWFYSNPLKKGTIFREKFLFLLTEAGLLFFVITVIGLTENKLAGGRLDLFFFFLYNVTQLILFINLLCVGIFSTSSGSPRAVLFGSVICVVGYLLAGLVNVNGGLHLAALISPFAYGSGWYLLKHHFIFWQALLLHLPVMLFLLIRSYLKFCKRVPKYD